MSALRRLVAGLLYAAMCVGGFLIFAAALALVFGFLNAIFGGIVHGLWLNPKGVVGGLLQYGIPTVVSFWAAEHFVLPRLWPLFDRLERWKTQEQ